MKLYFAYGSNMWREQMKNVVLIKGNLEMEY